MYAEWSSDHCWVSMQVQFGQVLHHPGDVETSLRQELPGKVKMLLDVFKMVVTHWRGGAGAEHKEGQWQQNTDSGDVKVPLLGGLGINPWFKDFFEYEISWEGDTGGRYHRDVFKASS